MKQWDTLDVIEQNPEVVSGAWVFTGSFTPIP